MTDHDPFYGTYVRRGKRRRQIYPPPLEFKLNFDQFFAAPDEWVFSEKQRAKRFWRDTKDFRRLADMVKAWDKLNS